MTYIQQIRDGVKELTESLNEGGLRGDIIDQKKTWVIFYNKEIERLTGVKNGRRIYKTHRRTNKRLETKQQTPGRPKGRLEKEHNNNGVFAG